MTNIGVLDALVVEIRRLAWTNFLIVFLSYSGYAGCIDLRKASIQNRLCHILYKYNAFACEYKVNIWDADHLHQRSFSVFFSNDASFQFYIFFTISNGASIWDKIDFD